MSKRSHVKKDNYNFINVVAVIACLGVIVVILTVLFASYIFDKTAEPAGEQSEETSALSSGDESITESGDVSDGTVSEPGTSTEENSVSADDNFAYITLGQADIHKGTLIIVNNDNKYDFTQNIALTNIYENRTGNYKLANGSLEIASEVMKPLNDMLDGLYASVGVNSLTLTAAYRSEADQQTAYEESKDTAVGGGSDLNTSYSFKCTVYPTSDGSLTEGKFLWLAENCKSYGFILRYPEGKTSITNYEACSNYFRYVGEPHAYLIALNNYCLEEYVDFCKRFSYDNKYTIEYDGVKYAIYYCAVAPDGDTQVKVPAGSEYTVSGDNVSGFIITVKLG